MAPAVSGLLHADAYSRAVLPDRAGSRGSTSHSMTRTRHRAVYLRIKVLAPIHALRAVHNGSVNDHAGNAIAGAIVLIAALSWV